MKINQLNLFKDRKIDIAFDGINKKLGDAIISYKNSVCDLHFACKSWSYNKYGCVEIYVADGTMMIVPLSEIFMLQLPADKFNKMEVDIMNGGFIDVDELRERSRKPYTGFECMNEDEEEEEKEADTESKLDYNHNHNSSVFIHDNTVVDNKGENNNDRES